MEAQGHSLLYSKFEVQPGLHESLKMKWKSCQWAVVSLEWPLLHVQPVKHLENLNVCYLCGLVPLWWQQDIFRGVWLILQSTLTFFMNQACCIGIHSETAFTILQFLKMATEYWEMSGARHLFRQASSEVMEFNQKWRGTCRGIFILNYEGYKCGRSPESHQGTLEPGTYLKVTQERFQCIPIIQTLHEKPILSAQLHS